MNKSKPMGKRRNSKLEVGQKVVASFLGALHNCVVTEIVDKDTYKVSTRQGTILPSCKWKDKTPTARKGKITSPWFIVKTGIKTYEDEQKSTRKNNDDT